MTVAMLISASIVALLRPALIAVAAAGLAACAAESMQYSRAVCWNKYDKAGNLDQRLALVEKCVEDRRAGRKEP